MPLYMMTDRKDNPFFNNIKNNRSIIKNELYNCAVTNNDSPIITFIGNNDSPTIPVAPIRATLYFFITRN